MFINCKSDKASCLNWKDLKPAPIHLRWTSIWLDTGVDSHQLIYRTPLAGPQFQTSSRRQQQMAKIGRTHGPHEWTRLHETSWALRTRDPVWRREISCIHLLRGGEIRALHIQADEYLTTCQGHLPGGTTKVSKWKGELLLCIYANKATRKNTNTAWQEQNWWIMRYHHHL